MADHDPPIGYGSPPRHSRWVPGQSGNPSGRKRGAKGLGRLVSQELDKTVAVTEAGRRVRLRKREVLARRLVHEALAGNRSAVAEVLRLDAEMLATIQAVSSALEAEQDGETRASLGRRIRAAIAAGTESAESGWSNGSA